MKQFLISPPFGNVLSHKKCTSIVGTFTLKPRGSNWTKLYRLIKTTRPVSGGWVNNVGFQNPGIHSIKRFKTENIYSIAALTESEWDGLLEAVPAQVGVEVNMGCPNVREHPDITDVQVKTYIEKFPLVILKLSPTAHALDEIKRFASLGINHFHLFNTIPTESGGESGKRLQEISLKTIRQAKALHPHIKIIGGGGIYTPKDVLLYKEAGADCFSLGSIFLNPIRARRLLKSL